MGDSYLLLLFLTREGEERSFEWLLSVSYQSNQRLSILFDRDRVKGAWVALEISKCLKEGRKTGVYL